MPTPTNQAPDTPTTTTPLTTHRARIQGRESELKLIGERLDEVESGAGRVIVVEGASGIGKSRLLLEALGDAKRRGMRFGVSMAEPSERTVELAALLRALVGQAAGSPYLVVETLLGLQQENRIRIVDGRAEVLDGRLPDRVRTGMRERLARLSRPANEAVTVAASLGRAFTFAELAETL